MPRQLADLFRTIKILVVDDDQCMRKVVRAMLTAIGVREIYDASDGISGLQAIRAIVPDIVILDWEMPQLSGAEFIRSVRSPGTFPVPNIPIIVLSGHGEHSCVVEATKLGANEYLLKPVSTKALFDRLASVLTRPRPMVRIGDYYGPKPRNRKFGFEQVDIEPANPAAPRENQQDRSDDENGDNIVLI